jgi:hypothetical protein
VLSAPTRIPKRSGYGKAQVDFASARMKFIDRATPTTWADTVKAARRVHAEAKLVRQAEDEREREAAASRAATDEGGQDLMLCDISTTLIYAHVSTKKQRADIARYLEGGA